MFLLDSLLVGGLRFVLQRIGDIADKELNDPEQWRTALIELQQRLETGEIDEATFAANERVILERLRDLQPAREVMQASAVSAIEVEIGGDDDPERGR